MALRQMMSRQGLPAEMQETMVDAFRDAPAQVRMMMLDCDCRQPAFFQSIACRIVIGVQIMRDPLWFDFEKPAHVTDRIPERFIDLEVFQVSDVLAQKSAVAAGQADGVLQLRTDSGIEITLNAGNVHILK